MWDRSSVSSFVHIPVFLCMTNAIPEALANAGTEADLISNIDSNGIDQRYKNYMDHTCPFSIRARIAMANSLLLTVPV